ncbi:MAG: hypothetical protein PHE48_03105 [Candidatus Daviesbacteria bacterium]|nr:hypothetical protein [Candidatus Daviesbacteria bacterium]
MITPDNELLISDQRIREILTSFGRLLHKAIRGAVGFRSLSYGGIHGEAVRPMLDDEVNLWDKHFNIRHLLEESVLANRLYALDVPADMLEDYQHSLISAVRPKPNDGRDYFITYQSGVSFWTPMVPLDSQDVKFMITPHVFFHGRFMAKLDGMSIAFQGEGLDNAVLDLEIHAQDAQERWVYSQSPGTSRNAGIFGIHDVAVSSIHFNRTIKRGHPNSLDLSSGVENGLLFVWCNIHKLGTLKDLVIPDDPGLRLYFWQLDRFMKNDALESHLLLKLPTGK